MRESNSPGIHAACVAAMAGPLALIALLLAATHGLGQENDQAKSKAVKAKQNAKYFEKNATVITLYDREGKKLGTVSERAIYGDTVLSPDRTRVAAVKFDQEAENADLWILDIASGKGTRITTSARGEGVNSPVWSPDGRQVVYVTIRGGSEGLYRRSSNGEGAEELLYKNSGAFMVVSDWSSDGRFLAFVKSGLSGGALYVLPVSGDREPIEIFRSESRMFAPRFSPDARFLSYVLFRDGRNEVWVRPVNSETAAGPWQVSEDSRGLGGSDAFSTAAAFWRRDGKELYYRGIDQSVMVAKVTTSPTFKFARPKVLFRPPGSIPAFIRNISSDGERFLALPPPRGPQLQQITLFDRNGKVVKKIADPGLYAQPVFSPDGTRVAVLRTDLKNSRQNIWIFETGTGKTLQLTNDGLGQNTPMWSPDGKQILYVSFRGNYRGVYRRAWNVSGPEELLFRYTPGAELFLSDISPDGKFLACDSGGVLLIVPLTKGDALTRTAIEFSREEFEVSGGRFSPDGRFLAYASNEADPDKTEVYVRTFDAATGTAGQGKWQVSKNGSAGLQAWRADGKEFFFRQYPDPGMDDLRLMSAAVSTTPMFQAGMPKMLFKLPGPVRGNAGNISRDGERFVFVLDVPADAPGDFSPGRK